MKNRYFEVGVVRREFGYAIVKASDKEEAVKLVNQGRYKDERFYPGIDVSAQNIPDNVREIMDDETEN